MKITLESLMAGEHLPYTISNLVLKMDGEIHPNVIEADDLENYIKFYDTSKYSPGMTYVPISYKEGNVTFEISEPFVAPGEIK